MLATHPAFNRPTVHRAVVHSDSGLTGGRPVPRFHQRGGWPQPPAQQHARAHLTTTSPHRQLRPIAMQISAIRIVTLRQHSFDVEERTLPLFWGAYPIAPSLPLTPSLPPAHSLRLLPFLPPSGSLTPSWTSLAFALSSQPSSRTRAAPSCGGMRCASSGEATGPCPAPKPSFAFDPSATTTQRSTCHQGGGSDWCCPVLLVTQILDRVIAQWSMDAGVDHAAAGGHRSMHDEWYIVGRLRDWAPPNPILELWRRAVCGEPGERFKAGEGPHSIVLSFPRFGLSLSLARSVRARSGVVVSGRWSPLRLGAIQSHHSYRMMPPLSGPGLEPVLRQPLGDLDDARAVWDRRALRRPAVPRLGAAATVVPA